MARVTRLIYQKRNKELVNVHLDDEYAFAVSAVIGAELTRGQELSQVQIDHLRQRDSVERGKHIAVRYLSYRPRSASEIRVHLASKGLDDDSCQKVVERLEESGLIDDLAFARYWVDQRETFRPRSRRALAHELFQKGVGQETIDEAVSSVDEASAANRAAGARADRWRALPRKEFAVKMKRFLRARGFNFEIIRQVDAELWRKVTADELNN